MQTSKKDEAGESPRRQDGIPEAMALRLPQAELSPAMQAYFDKCREKLGYVLYPGLFPEALPSVKCDVITMLAVLEHIPADGQAELAAACHEILNPGGRVVVTVPSPRVDTILDVLGRLRVIDGMSLEEHYGFEPEDTLRVFGPPAFRLAESSRFQLGLNNLFVFEKPAVAAG